MPKLIATHHVQSPVDDDDLYSQQVFTEGNTDRNADQDGSWPSLGTRDPTRLRTTTPRRADERTSLLRGDSQRSIYQSTDARSPHDWSRHLTSSQTLRSRAASRRSSFSRRPGLGASYLEANRPETPLRSAFHDHKIWYDQFNSIDWLRDNIADAVRVKELRARKDWRGRLQAGFDGAQGWALVAVIGCLTAATAYLIDVTEATLFDYKTGFCKTAWWHNKRRCCNGASTCEDWSRWSVLFGVTGAADAWDFAAFCTWACLLAVLACLVTSTTKTTISSHVSLPTLDENLGAEQQCKDRFPESPRGFAISKPIRTFYPAAGAGIAETKVICSGFVLRGYLGLRTLSAKCIALILSVSSGLVLGKEGPYVHISCCIGNITSRIFHKYDHNDAKKREILSASAAAGIAVAFGAPLGGVLYSLEEVSYFFPSRTLFRTFFCCIVAALSLKFLDPYGSGRIVPFEVRYLTGWRAFEIIIFIALGIIGGVLGALIIKACRLWARTFRRIHIIKRSPLFEVFLVALITGLISYSNRYTRLPVAELLFELSAPCNSFSDTGKSLCATQERVPEVIKLLAFTFAVKTLLTIITFGLRVPAGIFIPAAVSGGLIGRLLGHVVQYAILEAPELARIVGCEEGANPESCVVPGVYALAAAGATMCGVTRLSLSLAIILFELTGSLEHVLPFSLAVLIAKWTADHLEPHNIYDLLLDSYPYLDANARPIFNTTELSDITPTLRPSDYIDISESAWVPASELRGRLQRLQLAGDLDGAVPIVRHRLLKGLIPAPDLEFALDSIELEKEADSLCYMDPHHPVPDRGRLQIHREYGDIIVDTVSSDDETENETIDESLLVDISSMVNPSPICLDITSPMELAFEVFSKLGLRHVCILSEGQLAGLLHKKTFVKHVKEAEKMH